MRTLIELKRDRTFLDSIIEYYGNGLVSDLIFKVFGIAESHLDMDYDLVPDEFEQALDEIEDLDNFSTEWLKANIDTIPYFCDIESESRWGLSYGPGGWSDASSKERIEFLKVFTDNKDLLVSSFLEKLYYENNEVFVFLCMEANLGIKYIKAGLGSYSDGEDMCASSEWFDEDNYKEVLVLRTYDFTYVIMSGCGSMGMGWAEGIIISKFDLNQSTDHKNFTSSIQPLSIENSCIYKEKPVSSEQILRWLYGEAQTI